MKVLVLGASGFIGGAVAQRLAARGDEVTAGVRGESRADGRSNLTVETVDIGDPDRIAEVARGHHAIVHAAGIATPLADRRALRWTHIAGTENVLRAAAHVGVPRLIHISCQDVTLQAGPRIHWNEGREVAGGPFGERARSLKLAEEVALAGAGTSQLETIALRGAWVWGPGDRSRLPSLIREAEAGGIRLAGAGRNLLSLTYIDHLTDAVLASLDAGRDVCGRVYSIGDGAFLEAREFFGALSEALGLPAPRMGLPLRLGLFLDRLRHGAGSGPAAARLQRGASTFFDVNDAIGELGVSPAVQLADGMAALAAWVEREGGIEAVASADRPVADAASVDAQVALAGGD